jgi:hypothetical protein
MITPAAMNGGNVFLCSALLFVNLESHDSSSPPRGLPRLELRASFAPCILHKRGEKSRRSDQSRQLAKGIELSLAVCSQETTKNPGVERNTSLHLLMNLLPVSLQRSPQRWGLQFYSRPFLLILESAHATW